MKGLALSKAYFQECFPLLQQACPDAMSVAAVGLVGEGSDCFGFDDKISRDHDWGPGFCIWLPEDKMSDYAEPLQMAYDRLPQVFCDFIRNQQPEATERVGVMSVEGFYRRYIGYPTGPQTARQWLSVPESYLAVVTNGRVFYDPNHYFLGIREHLLRFYPEDVRRKKLAARVMSLSQAGQYQFPRCIARGDMPAARLALDEFLRGFYSAAHLLSRRYTPYYKWMHRSLAEIPQWRSALPLLKKLAASSAVEFDPEPVEKLCLLLLDELVRQELCLPGDKFLLRHSSEIIDGISDPDIRAIHVSA